MSLASWLCSVPGAATACDYSGLGQYRQQTSSIKYSHEPGNIPICHTGIVKESSDDCFDTYLNPAQTYTYTNPDDFDLPIKEPESFDSDKQSKGTYYHHDHRQNHHHHYSSQSRSDSRWLGLAAASTASLTLGAGGATAACTSKKPLTREEYDALPCYHKFALYAKTRALRTGASLLSGLADQQIPQSTTDGATVQRAQGWLSWGGSMAWDTGASIAGTLMNSIWYIRDTVTAASVSAYEIASKRVNRWYTLGVESAKTSVQGTQTLSRSKDDGIQTEATESMGVTETTEVTEESVAGASHSVG